MVSQVGKDSSDSPRTCPDLDISPGFPHSSDLIVLSPFPQQIYHLILRNLNNYSRSLPHRSLKRMPCKLEAKAYCLQSIRQGPSIALSSAWVCIHLQEAQGPHSPEPALVWLPPNPGKKDTLARRNLLSSCELSIKQCVYTCQLQAWQMH